jgi:hypothetical protein
VTLRSTTLILCLCVSPTLAASQALNVYHLGNSLTDQMRYRSLRDTASALGDTYVYGRHMRTGTTLDGLWTNPVSGFTERPYGTYPNAFANYKWDAVTFQPFDRMMYGFDNSDLPQIRQFIDLARTNPANEDTQFYIYQRWPRRDSPVNGVYPAFNYQSMFDRPYTHLNWGNSYATRNTNETRDYFDRLLGMVRSSYTDMKNPVMLVPVGDVLYRLDQKLRAGAVPGMSDVSAIYLDTGHLTEAGSLVVGTTFYSTLFAADPRGAPGSAYGITDPTFVRVAQETVWEVVRSHPNAIAGAPRYSVDRDGQWMDASVWTRLAIPDGPAAVARLGAYNTAARSVDIGGRAITLDQLQVEGNFAYTLTGDDESQFRFAGNTPQAITLAASVPSLSVQPQTVLDKDVSLQLDETQLLTFERDLALTGQFTQDGGEVRIKTLTGEGSYFLRAGRTTLTGIDCDVPSTLSSLLLARNTLFDIGVGRLILDWADDEESPLTRVQADIAAGRLIATGAMPGTKLTVLPNADLALNDQLGLQLDSSSLVLTLALAGDATLDGLVDFADLLALAGNYNSDSANWFEGDFNGDGRVDFTDLLTLSAGYQAGPTSTFAADWSNAQALVPEPGTLGLSILTLPVLVRRRRAKLDG